MKSIKCGEKKVRVSQKMFIKKDGVFGKILVNENCPHVNGDCGNCKNCYGKIALVEVDVFDVKFGDYKPNKELLRDRYYESGKNIVSKLDATNYINSCDVISVSEEDKKDNVGSMSVSPWYYTDRPLTWKSDCKACKQKYKDKLTPCQNTEENIKNGRLPHFCGEQKSRILKFY